MCSLRPPPLPCLFIFPPSPYSLSQTSSVVTMTMQALLRVMSTDSPSCRPRDDNTDMQRHARGFAAKSTATPLLVSLPSRPFLVLPFHLFQFPFLLHAGTPRNNSYGKIQFTVARSVWQDVTTKAYATTIKTYLLLMMTASSYSCIQQDLLLRRDRATRFVTQLITEFQEVTWPKSHPRGSKWSSQDY